jgi:hypothetical protein
MGCESAQGFFFARPMPAEAIAAHLAGWATHPLRLPHLAVTEPAR